MLGDLGRDAEVRVLLLAHETRAVLHVDAEAPFVRGRVGSATVPETAVEDHHAARRHLDRADVDTFERLAAGDRLEAM